MISWDRYNVIVNGFKGTPLTFSKSIIMIIFSWVWALGWSVCPLVGWGYYGILFKLNLLKYSYSNFFILSYGWNARNVSFFFVK